MNSLIVVTIVSLSYFFYNEFQNTLNDRVLLQLKSIKRLKRLHIENYLQEEWLRFEDQANSGGLSFTFTNGLYLYDESQKDDLLDSIVTTGKVNGIHDITFQSPEGKLTLLFIIKLGDGNIVCKKNKESNIQSILLERTGMGHSGETYIVGSDFHLRSESRFSQKTQPYQIIAKTKGVLYALNGKEGTAIYEDYRGELVYGAFHLIKGKYFSWSILSEIDIREVAEPLGEMRKKLTYICLSVLVFVAILSMFLTHKITQPIVTASRFLSEMAAGKYDEEIMPLGTSTEVRHLYDSLIDLQQSLKAAVFFANEIGMMNLESTYKVVGKNDRLGESLITMRDKLKEFQRIGEKNEQLSKQALIKGQENERKRLSKDLHDGLGPLLTSLKLMVQVAEIEQGKKIEIKNLIDHTIEEVRRMSSDLMPQALLDFGVGKALNHWVSLVRKSSDIDIEYINSMEEPRKVIFQEMDICLFRIIQELLNNAVRHSKASKIYLSLTEFDDKVSMFYSDNGVGFDIDKTGDGSGLNNIRERVKVLNGYLSIHSEKNKTEIEVELPIENIS